MSDGITTCRRKVEQILGDELREALGTSFPGLSVVAGRADASVKPPYVTVVLGPMERIAPGVYRAEDAKVACVSSIDELSEVHDARVARVEEILEEEITLPLDAGSARIHGYTVTNLAPVWDQQTFSDVLHLAMGVSG